MKQVPMKMCCAVNGAWHTDMKFITGMGAIFLTIPSFSLHLAFSFFNEISVY